MTNLRFIIRMNLLNVLSPDALHMQAERKDALWMRLVSARLHWSGAAAVETPLVGLYPGKTRAPVCAPILESPVLKQPRLSTGKSNHVKNER